MSAAETIPVVMDEADGGIEYLPGDTVVTCGGMQYTLRTFGRMMLTSVASVRLPDEHLCRSEGWQNEARRLRGVEIVVRDTMPTVPE